MTSKLKLDESSSILLTAYFRRITSIVFSKYKNDYVEITKPISDLYRENTFFIEERFKGIDISIKTNPPVINRFKFEKNYKNYCTNFYVALKKMGKIDADTTNENFEIIFSLKITNKNFKKVNWIDSVFQLKNLIVLMMKYKILDNDINYLSTIENCFQLKGQDLSRKKLDARGKPHTIEYQINLLEKIFIDKTKKEFFH